MKRMEITDKLVLEKYLYISSSDLKELIYSLKPAFLPLRWYLESLGEF